MRIEQQRELLKEILSKEKGKKTVYLIDKYKEEIFKIIPELKDEDGFEQKNPWHMYDVWNHTLKAIEKSRPDFEIRLTLLLHDIGKPHSYQDDGEIRHFRGHSEKSAEISKDILERLGYDEKEKNEILYLIKNHSTTIETDKVNRDNLELTKKLLYVQYCDTSAYNPEYIPEAMEKLNEIGQKLIDIRESFKEEEQR